MVSRRLFGGLVFPIALFLALFLAPVSSTAANADQWVCRYQGSGASWVLKPGQNPTLISTPYLPGTWYLIGGGNLGYVLGASTTTPSNADCPAVPAGVAPSPEPGPDNVTSARTSSGRSTMPVPHGTSAGGQPSTSTDNQTQAAASERARPASANPDRPSVRPGESGPRPDDRSAPSATPQGSAGAPGTAAREPSEAGGVTGSTQVTSTSAGSRRDVGSAVAIQAPVSASGIPTGRAQPAPSGVDPIVPVGVGAGVVVVSGVLLARRLL